jgi:hypothetical protein
MCAILLRVLAEQPSAWLPERWHTTDWHSGCSPKGIFGTVKLTGAHLSFCRALGIEIRVARANETAHNVPTVCPTAEDAAWETVC